MKTKTMAKNKINASVNTQYSCCDRMIQRGEIMNKQLMLSGSMRKVVYTGILIAGVSPALALAAPTVTGVNGSLSTGGTITISGNSFGSHPMQVESLQSNIEAGTTGQALSKPGWSLFNEANWEDPLYATDASHSGSKSLKCTNYVTTYNCAFAYDMPNVLASQRFYVTWWTKYEGDNNGQWKMFRASSPLSIVDGPQEVIMSNWFDVQRYILINPTGPANNNNYMGNYYPKGDGKWHRIELDFVAGSTNNANGSIELRITTDTGVISSQLLTSKITHEAAGAAWNYAIWQNYFGNGHTNGGRIWFDDIYVQYNTPARIELCSGSTWSNRGKCEIQVPTSWGASSISATVNTGSFASGSTAYLYIVDSTGTANSTGNNVTIGNSASTPLTPPAPSLNMIKIQ